MSLKARIPRSLPVHIHKVRDGIITPLDPCPLDATWRTIASHTDYEVSEYGHIRRRVRSVNRAALFPIKVQKKGFYFGVNLWGGDRYSSLLVHRIVAIAFIGAPPSDSHQIAHGDGIPENCHHTNLRWATAYENMEDQRKHGTRVLGARVNTCKLSASEVVEVFESTKPQRDIARQFGITQSAVQSIRSRKVWRSVTDALPGRSTDWLAHRGAGSGKAKLCEAQVLLIWDLLNKGSSDRDISAQFGVHRDTIYAIRIGRTWIHVTGAK